MPASRRKEPEFRLSSGQKDDYYGNFDAANELRFMIEQFWHAKGFHGIQTWLLKRKQKATGSKEFYTVGSNIGRNGTPPKAEPALALAA